MSDTRDSVRSRWLVVLAVLVGFLISCYQLDSKSLWQDEIIALDRITTPADVLGLIREAFASRNLAFISLHYLIQRLFLGVLEPVYALRFPSVAAAVVSIALAYHFCQRAIGRKIAVYSAFLLALAPLHLRYAQEGRYYALVEMLTLAGFVLLEQALRTKRRGYWFAWAAACVAGLYTHVFMVFPVALQVAYISLGALETTSRRLYWRNALMALAVIGLCIIPLIPAAYSSYIGAGSQNPDNSLGQTRITANPLSWWSVLRLFSGGTTAALAASLALLAAGGIFLWKQKRGLLVSAVSIILLPFSLVISMRFSHGIVIRYFIFALPVFLMIVASGVHAAGVWLVGLLRHRNNPGMAVYNMAALGLLTMLIATTAPTLSTYYHESKQDWRSAYQIVQLLGRQTDHVLVHRVEMRAAFRYYGDSPRYIRGLVTADNVSSGTDLEGFNSTDSGWILLPSWDVSWATNNQNTGESPQFLTFPPIILATGMLPQDHAVIANALFRSPALVFFEPARGRSHLMPDDLRRFAGWVDKVEAAGFVLDRDLMDAITSYCVEAPDTELKLTALLGRDGVNDLMLNRILAVLAYNRGDWARAASLLESSIYENGDIRFILMLAHSYRNMQDYKSAESVYQEAIRRRPKGHAIIAEYADMLRQLGRAPEASQKYQSAIELAPDRVAYRLALAETLLESGQVDKAKAVYQEILRLYPNNQKARSGLKQLE